MKKSFTRIRMIFFSITVTISLISILFVLKHIRLELGSDELVGSRFQMNDIKDPGLRSNKFKTITPAIDTIFVKDHSWTATLSVEKITKILVTGDVLPARSVNAQVMARNNPLWPYEKVSGFINSLNPDITFVNLETPLLENCPVTNEGMIFCGDSKNIEGLKLIEADIVSVANNHIGNYQLNGIKETLGYIKNAGMLPVGESGPIYKTVNGVKFSFLAYNDIEKNNIGIDLADEPIIARDLKKARKNADVVIIMFHWGAEYRSQPDERQKYLAHYAIEQGADLIVSNHPHWIQPLEIYNGKLIMYAHGNFIFDQMWSEETRTGVLGLYTFYEKDLIDVEYFPLKIFDYGQAVFLEGKEKQEVINNLKEESLILQVK